MYYVPSEGNEWQETHKHFSLCQLFSPAIRSAFRVSSFYTAFRSQVQMFSFYLNIMEFKMKIFYYRILLLYTFIFLVISVSLFCKFWRYIHWNSLEWWCVKRNGGQNVPQDKSMVYRQNVYGTLTRYILNLSKIQLVYITRYFRVNYITAHSENYLWIIVFYSTS